MEIKTPKTGGILGELALLADFVGGQLGGVGVKMLGVSWGVLGVSWGVLGGIGPPAGAGKFVGRG